MYSEDELQGSSPESRSESEPEPAPLLVSVSVPAPAHQRPLLLNPAYARCKSVMHDELRSFRVFLQWCALDHSTRAGRAVSYAAFLALALAVPAAVSLSLRADAALSPASASAITFNRVAQVPATGLAAISFLTLAAFFRRLGSLRQLLFLDGALRDDTAFVRRGYARELDRAFRLLAALLLPSLCVEAAHKAVFFFCTVRVEPPPVVASPLFLLPAPVPWRAVALVATVVSWVYRTGVFLLVCVLFRLTCELQILRFEGIYHMFDVEARAAAAEIFAEHRRIRTQLFATSHRYRVFIICCLVTITVSQLGALVVALSSRAPKSFSNTGDLLVGSAVQLSGFFMCLVGAARITHRAQRIVSIASQWHMSMVAMHHGKSSPANTSAIDADASRVSAGSSTAVSQADPGAPCSYRSRQALVTYLRHNGGGITLFGFTLDRGLLHTIFVFEMTLVLWILSKVVVL
ncbi:hypothetical protein U9M48_038273 [Paspalum notatum var. saurae]|uniref:Uncharacterized protein n=1 Tax=Paspalum notatum var. saurae TaxID=547442 RepID=A0AAQ3UGQ4_PASNO